MESALAKLKDKDQEFERKRRVCSAL